MAITYKTIINNAIKGYNDIQDKLYGLGAVYTDGAGTVHNIGASSTTSPLSVSNILLSDAFTSASISAEKVSLTNPSVTITKSDGTAKLSSTATDWYISIGKSTTNGSGSFRGKTTSSGYVKNGVTSSATSIGTITPSVSGDGTVYIQAGSHTATATLKGKASATGTLGGTGTNIATTTKPTSGTDGTNYWTFTPGASAAAGTATATSTATEGYIAGGSKSAEVSVPVTTSSGTSYYLSKLSGMNFNASGNAALTVGTLDSGYYPLTASSLSVTGVTSSAGYINSGATFSGTLSNKVVGKIAAGAYSASSTNSTNMTTATNSTSSYYFTSKGKATVGTAGYIPTGSSEGSAVTTYVQAGSFTYSGNSVNGMKESSSTTNYYVTSSASNTEGYNTAHSSSQTTYIQAGSVKVSARSAASTKTSVTSTGDNAGFVSLTRSVSPTVTEGYVTGGTAGDISITANIGESKTAASSGDVTPTSGKLLTKVSIPASSVTATNNVSISFTPNISWTNAVNGSTVTPTWDSTAGKYKVTSTATTSSATSTKYPSTTVSAG